ncbi:MAG: dTDP-Rha--alpha-D-GlcNAc-pyrophosphate polyprenol alpha-3-L-rhamnosyltransferase [Marinilabiliales bacterium]|nr:MAG: dTDP-Rha--alpha-D-GlcNAc-pyrophosphate polyprenol alpha-3-L-rhamnosyltransferase [Marinilabiliales bacterium]
MEKKIENSPLVSVVTVNYNQTKVTEEFLISMESISYPKVEVFVVDNASPIDDSDILKDKFPYINLIKSDKNLGFAGGNNLALPHCKGKYVLFINNDTEVEKGFLEPLVDVLEKDHSIGMVSPKIQYYHTKDTLQFAGFTKFNMLTIRNFAIGFGEIDKGQYDITCETGSIFGAAMLVPMRIIEEVGMMTEIFFLYYEEHDWAAHIERAGYKIYYQGKSLVLHKESISTVKDSPFQIYYINRGRILFARRNTKGFKRALTLLYLYFISGPKISLEFLSRNRLDLIKAYWRAVWWNITHQKSIVFGIPKLKRT